MLPRVVNILSAKEFLQPRSCDSIRIELLRKINQALNSETILYAVKVGLRSRTPIILVSNISICPIMVARQVAGSLFME